MRLALFLSCLIPIANGLTAQTPTTGAVTGSVRDSSGAPIPNAQVFAIGTTRSVLADSLGTYRLDGMAPGRYDLRAAFVGYRPMAIRRVDVIGEMMTRLDFTLATAITDVGCTLGSLIEPPLVPRDLTTTRWTVVGLPGK